jgi:hypothetical protein
VELEESLPEASDPPESPEPASQVGQPIPPSVPPPVSAPFAPSADPSGEAVVELPLQAAMAAQTATSAEIVLIEVRVMDACQGSHMRRVHANEAHPGVGRLTGAMPHG